MTLPALGNVGYRLVTARRSRAAFVLGMIGALLCLPIVRAGASGEVVLTGWVRHDHGDIFGTDRTVEYTVLDTGGEQLNLVGGPARTLAPGTKVRVRGTRTGDKLVLNPRQAVTTLASGQSTSGPTMQAEAQLTAAGKMARRVAVLLINFSQPTPTPPPTPTPTPTPLPSGSPQPSASPLPTQTAQPTESPPIDANEASPSPASPAPTPTPTVVPTPTVAPTPTVDPTPSPSPTASPPPEPWTPETVRGMYFTNSRSVASYYADLSEGMMSIAGDVYGWYTVPADTTDCHYNGWATAAKDAAAQHGVDLSAYTNVVYAFPKQSVCWWSGLANVTGRNSWINGSMSLFVTSHELGHNFGVHHASSLTCKKGGARVAFSSNCTSDEYGDPFDIMGYHGQRLMSNWHRWQIGFLSAAEVQTVVVDGTYRVATAETAGLSPRIVRIPRPGGDYYYLEYRQPYGEWDDFKSTAAVVNGVTIRIAPDVSKVIQSQLIDTHPETSTFGDASLGLAETYGDDINRIYVTTVALDPSGASVLVHFGPDTSPPTSPSQLHATTPADGSVALAWQKSTDDRWVAGYRIERDGQALGTTLGTSFVDVPAQQARSYAYRVVAIDEAGNESYPAMLGVYVPDTSRPTTPADLTASLTGTNTVELTWTAASDNVGVALYRIAVDGSDLADTTQPPYGDIVVADGMAHVFAVRALDAAGNTSDPAEVVQLVPDATPPELVGPLSADVRPDGSVQLSWPPATDNVGVDRYELWRDGSSLTATGSAGFVDAGPAQGAWHSYQVRAVDGAALFSEPIMTSVYVPDTVAPVGPGALDVWLSDPDTAALSWTPAVDNVGTDHYLVSQDGQQLSATAQTWLAGVAVRQGEATTFGVTAYDAAGNAGPTVSTTIDVPDVTPPTAGVLSASATGPNSVSLSWTQATDNVGLAGYKVIRDGQVIASLAADASAFADGPLVSDHTYSYIVCALDLAGNIADRAATVTLVSKDVTAPSRPATLVATPFGHRRIGLQWAASTDDRPGTLRYQVFRGRKKIATVTTTSFEDRPSVVKIYKYKVRAVDAAGNKSPFSPTVSVKAARRV